jgi:hypothetical protein
MVHVLPLADSASLQATYQWDISTSSRVSAAAGSAALLTELIHAACTQSGNGRSGLVSGPTIPDSSLANPNDDTHARAYSIWQPFPARVDTAELVWHMHTFLGLQPGTKSPERSRDDDSPPESLVIDDSNLGFRTREDAWPKYMQTGPAPEHVILKMSSPLASGPLWDVLTR